MKNVSLEDFKLPHILLYEDGRIYDLNINEWRKLQKNGQMEYVSPITNKRVRIPHARTMRYCFNAPWTQSDVTWTNLDRFGFNFNYAMRDGRIFSGHTMVWLTPCLTDEGYHRVCMQSSKKGGNSLELVHRIIAKSFVPNPHNKPEANHDDGNKDHNYADNLTWMTAAENCEHARKFNLRKRAIEDNDIHNICQMLEMGYKVKEIMLECNCPKHHVLTIKSGCHMRISKNYKIPRNKHFSLKGL